MKLEWELLSGQCPAKLGNQQCIFSEAIHTGRSKFVCSAKD